MPLADHLEQHFPKMTEVQGSAKACGTWIHVVGSIVLSAGSQECEGGVTQTSTSP